MTRLIHRLALYALVAVAASCWLAPHAGADEFQLPGLSADSDRYVDGLAHRFPAGGTPQARRAAEQQAAAAQQKKDWAGVVTALETRVALGDATSRQFLDLATALMRRTPPDPRRALAAAWRGFQTAENTAGEIGPLLIIAEALRAQDRPAQSVQALEQVVQRAPDNDEYARMLADAQRATGLLVRNVTTQTEADPPRACISFTVAPVRRADFNAADWVRLDPPVQGAAVTREGDQICVSGLAAGATTQVVLRAGLPGEGGLNLMKEARLDVVVPNREPRILFDTRLFVLPRGQAPAATLTTVNLSSVKLRLLRLTERNVAVFLRDHRMGEQLESYVANTIAEDTGRVVWEGRADIGKWEANKAARTALPFPDALLNAGPGLYAFQAQPGDGTPGYSDGAVQLILRTDLAPTVWRGTDGLTVQMRGYADAKVRPGVKLQLLAHNNDVLGEATTDEQGIARFAAPLMHGEGPLAPSVVHAFGADDDFAALDLNAAAFDLSDRGVEGAPHPGPLDSYLWTDRGIYRPGETVQLMALPRDAAGAPADFPARVVVKRPNGQVFQQTTPARAADDSIYLPVTLSNSAPVGIWTAELFSDPDAPPIGHVEFRVDAFVPDRMAVETGPAPDAIIPGKTAILPVTARFLYGAPAAGLTGKATLRLVVDKQPFPALAGYHIGLTDETYAPDSHEVDLPETDAQGHTALTIDIAQAPDTTQAVKAQIDLSVDDPSGHASRASTAIPVRPAGPLIGVKPGFADDAVDAGTEAAFDVAAVGPDGARVPLQARLRLVRERPDWRLVFEGRLARYETVWKDEPLETSDIAIPADGVFHFAKRLDFGRYRIEVAQDGGMAITSYRFRSGWAGSDNPDVPDRVDVSVDRRSVPAGETARIHIAAPFAGEATLLVLTDRVHALRTLAVPEGGTDVDVPVEAGWGPGAYVTVHVFRTDAATKSARPARAIGLVWVGVDPAARMLDLAIDAPDKTTPRGRATVKLHTAPGAWVTLAAVDEGILRLTSFVSPDPAPHFLGRRRLGLDIRDDWGRLIAPAEGEATLLRQGGDEGSFVLPETPQHTVTLFTPPVQAGPDGVAEVPLDLPDFNGQVRLMAVGWQGSRIGSAARDMIVRDALVAEPLLPRFLAPGDSARLAVLLQSVDLPGGDAAVGITTEGPLAIDGTSRLTATLAPGAQAVPSTVLHATGAGRGVIHLDVTGAGGFHIQREAAMWVRPARGPVTNVVAGELAPGAEAKLSPPIDRFVPGTWRASATFGAPVRYDAAALVQALSDYPLSCLEQATSRGLPLAMLPDGKLAGEDRTGRLQTSVQLVLDRQRYDGGFALWRPSGEAEPWLSAYAMDFLLRARDAGATVPDPVIADGLKFLAEQADNAGDKPEDRAAQAYRLYVLAKAGKGKPGAARVLAQDLDSLPTPLARAQVGAALVLAHDLPRAETAFAAALAAPARKWWYADYGTALRDQAALAVLLKESGLLPEQLTRLMASLPGADLNPNGLSTQEQAWAAAAAAALGRDGRPGRVSIDGAALPAAPVQTSVLTGPAVAKNLGDHAIWQSVSITGVPAQAPPAARAGMRVTRQFFATDGSTLNLDTLKQNTVFILLVEGRADDGQDHRALLLQGLPAGWEIAGRLGAGKVPGAPWLGELSETEAEPAADDRYAAVIALTGDKPDFRVAVRLRAVTPGDYEIPGAELADMYRPGIFARQGANRIKVFSVE